jgi:hypothetical protein
MSPSKTPAGGRFIQAANDNSITKGSALPFKLEMYSAIDPTTRKDWVVRDFLRRGEFSAWYGRPGAGKSVIVGDLACHVAAGWDWFGHKVQGGPVLYIAAERAAVVKRRFAAFRQEHQGRRPAASRGEWVRRPLLGFEARDRSNPDDRGVRAGRRLPDGPCRYRHREPDAGRW